MSEDTRRKDIAAGQFRIDAASEEREEIEVRSIFARATENMMYRAPSGNLYFLAAGGEASDVRVAGLPMEESPFVAFCVAGAGRKGLYAGDLWRIASEAPVRAVTGRGLPVHYYGCDDWVDYHCRAASMEPSWERSLREHAAEGHSSS